MKKKEKKIFKNKVSREGVIGLCVLAEDLLKFPADIKQERIFLSNEYGTLKTCLSMETFKALEAIVNAGHNSLLEV